MSIFAQELAGPDNMSSRAPIARVPQTFAEQQEAEDAVAEDYQSPVAHREVIADYELFKKAFGDQKIAELLQPTETYENVSIEDAVLAGQAHEAKYKVAALKFLHSTDGYELGLKVGFDSEGVDRVAAMIKRESARLELTRLLEKPANDMLQLRRKAANKKAFG